jgi:hypothetical protein
MARVDSVIEALSRYQGDLKALGEWAITNGDGVQAKIRLARWIERNEPFIDARLSKRDGARFRRQIAKLSTTAAGSTGHVATRCGAIVMYLAALILELQEHPENLPPE